MLQHVRVLIGLLIVLASGVAQANARPDDVLAHLADEVEGVAVISDWPTADKMTGGQLASLLPISGTEAKPPERAVWIVARRAPDGGLRATLVMARGDVREEHLHAAQPWPKPGDPPVPARRVPPLYAMGEHVVIGASELLTGNASRATAHPLAEIVRASLPGSKVLIAVRGGLLTDWLGEEAPRLLGPAQVAACLLDTDSPPDAPISITCTLAMAVAKAQSHAPALRPHAMTHSKRVLGRLKAGDKAVTETDIALMTLASTLITWTRPGGREWVEGLHLSVAAPRVALIEALARTRHFPTARAAVEAHATAHREGSWGLLLATLSPDYRRTAINNRVVDPTALGTNDADWFYIVEPILVGPDTAQFRLRIQDTRGKTSADGVVTLKDLHLYLAQNDADWRITWLGPYVPAPN